MFGLFRSLRRWLAAADTPRLPRARLGLEQLEDRNCPAAPMLMGVTATHIGSWLVVQGSVTDELPATVQVSLGGAASATVTPSSSGSFSYFVAWPGGTQVTAQATDAEALTSSQSTATISTPGDANPYLTLSVSYGAQKQVTLSGKLIDESPANRTVTFYGSASGTATTDSNGDFSVTLTAGSLGPVNASATDAANHPTNTASVTLTSSAPVISNFNVSEEPDGWYEFTGNVADESPSGLTVRFGGASVSLAGQTCTVALDGTFTFRIQLNGLDTDNGTANAWLWDWWGQMSNTAQDVVYQTGT